MLPLVKRLGGKVVVECQKSLLPLLASCSGIDQLVAKGDELPAFTVQAPLLSLPRIVQTTLKSVPATIPYLLAARSLVNIWREKLRDVPGYRIGINWQGRPGRGAWRSRNIPLRQFAALAETSRRAAGEPAKGAGAGGLAVAVECFPLLDPGDELDEAHGAFMDTAAIMMNLDLVITSDTAVPHLAGALGVPVWLALPFASDWRWMLRRADSPWYPTMRLFRQRTPGNWAEVFEEIQEALREYLATWQR